MDMKEAHERYERAKKTADNLLHDVMFGAGAVADYHDALEIANLWRLALEGARFTEMTSARMIEATDK